MKIKLFAILIALGSLSLVSCNKMGSVSLKNETDSVSYCLGVSIGQNIKKGGAEKINYAVMEKAMDQALKGEKKFAVAEDKIPQILDAYFQKMMLAKGKKNQQAGQDFLKTNKERKGVVTTASCLQYEIIKAGNGPIPNDSDIVKVNYHGTLIDGKVFDSSVDRGTPVTFPVNGVIKGWTEALKMMPVGSKWKLCIPSELGYGERGAGGVIEGNSTLIFEVELLSIEPKPVAQKVDPKQIQAKQIQGKRK